MILPTIATRSPRFRLVFSAFRNASREFDVPKTMIPPYMRDGSKKLDALVPKSQYNNMILLNNQYRKDELFHLKRSVFSHRFIVKPIIKSNVASSSETLKKYISDANAIENNAYFALHSDGECGEIIYNYCPYEEVVEGVELTLGSVANILQRKFQARILEIQFPHHIRHTKEQYHAVLGCEVASKTEQARVVFSWQAIPATRFADVLGDLRELTAFSAGEFLSYHSIHRKIGTCIEQATNHKAPLQPNILLNKSEASLLKRAGVTKRKLLNIIRTEISMVRLKQGNTFKEIGYALGYSDVNAFSRAFKSWTGRSPSLAKEELEWRS